MKNTVKTFKNAVKQLRKIQAPSHEADKDIICEKTGMEAHLTGIILRSMFLKLSDKNITWENALKQIKNAKDKKSEAVSLFGVVYWEIALILAEKFKPS
jgi:hypothetical protein